MNLTRRQFLSGSLHTAAAFLLGLGRACLPGRARPQEGAFVLDLWSGALAATSIRVNARLSHDGATVRLLVSPDPDLSNPLLSAYATADLAANNRVARLSLGDLQPDTTYYYAVESGGLLDTAATGRFHTPGLGPYSFTFAFASCAITGSTHPVFDTIRQWNPLFYVTMGDFHYRDIGVNDRALFRDAYNQVLASPNQSALYRAAPCAYMWDDHDYGPNNSDKHAPGRLAARLTYQEYVPHYPLVAGSGDVPIYQAFTIGRVRFILTDTRSERDGAALPPDDPARSMMGAAQKAWFKQQLLDAQGVYPVVVWVSPSPWIADPPGSGIDNWNGFQAERRELADFLIAHNVNNLLVISGDVHMLAIDDGSNNRYATNGGRGFPIMQAAALESGPSYLSNNTYSEGQYPGRGQFGLMTITDDGGDSVSIRWSGRNAANQEIVHLELTAPPSPRLGVTPGPLLFAANNLGPQHLAETITITNRNVGLMTWAVATDPPVPWLSANPSSGAIGPGSSTLVTVSADPAVVGPGVYQASLRVTATPATDSPQERPVTFLKTILSPIALPFIPCA